MSANVVLTDGDIIAYNELPVKCTEETLDRNDCIFYKDLPKLMNDDERKIISDFKFKKPTLEQAAEDFKCGCDEAFNFLYRHYKKKFHYVASKYNNEDLVQELGMVLHHCARKYEAGGSSCFNTLFWTAAQNHIGMIQIRGNSKKRKNEFGEVSLNATMSDMDSTLENIVEDKAIDNEFDDILFQTILNQSILPKLNKEERGIVNMIVGGYTVKEVADSMHVNTANIYMKLKRMREKEGVSDILKSLYYHTNKVAKTA